MVLYELEVGRYIIEVVKERENACYSICLLYTITHGMIFFLTYCSLSPRSSHFSEFVVGRIISAFTYRVELHNISMDQEKRNYLGFTHKVIKSNRETNLFAKKANCEYSDACEFGFICLINLTYSNCSHWHKTKTYWRGLVNAMNIYTSTAIVKWKDCCIRL